MRTLLLAAAVALVLVVPQAARANDKLATGSVKYDQYGFRKGHAPRAAPWYLYWPYEAYFTYPAPTGYNLSPSYMSPNGFHPHMYQNVPMAPYPTNGFGQ
jgi:hypothetical protein